MKTLSLGAFLWSGVFSSLLSVGLSVSLFGVGSSLGYAQDMKGTFLIEDIIVRGAKRIDESTILSYLALKKGDQFSKELLDESLKFLFGTEMFSDISISLDGRSLIVEVEENPLIHRVAYEGNRDISNVRIEAETFLRSRMVYTLPKVKSDLERITNLYQRGGRFSVIVEPKIIKLKDNRVDLIFEIQEGAASQVESIHFIGNKHFSDKQLADKISTKTSSWYSKFIMSNVYDLDQMALDERLLQEFYHNEGYVDFKVISALTELTKNKKRFFITYSVDEGVRYRLGDVTVTTDITNLDMDALNTLITLEKGAWYDAADTDGNVALLTDAVGNLGFAFVEVVPNITRRADSPVPTVDLTLHIEEAERVFVERIEINGNVRTTEEVIRRQFRLVEGDAFNASKVRRSYRNLVGTGYFKSVEIDSRQGSSSDQLILDVTVSERSTGSLKLGAGYSTEEGLLGKIGLQERNFLGKGQTLNVSLNVGTKDTNVDVGFVEPYFMGRDLSAGVSVFHKTRDKSNLLSYNKAETGIQVGFGYDISESWSQNVSYSLKNVAISDIPSNASLYLKSQTGERVSSTVSQSLFYDQRDQMIDTHWGYYARLSNDLAGIGGDSKYLRSRLEAGFFYPLNESESVVFNVVGRTGYIFGLGDNDVWLNDRFFLGGASLRGFKAYGVGSRSVSETGKPGSALGGEWMYGGTLGIKVSLDEVAPIDGVDWIVFSDMGALGGIGEQAGSKTKQDTSPRVSVGTGLQWNSPLGIIGLTWAKPVVSKDYDVTQRLRFNLGTSF